VQFRRLPDDDGDLGALEDRFGKREQKEGKPQ
jgi:hypothetical protein